MDIVQLVVPHAQLRWASWSSPLVVAVSGLRLELLQKQAPLVRSADEERPCVAAAATKPCLCAADRGAPFPLGLGVCGCGCGCVCGCGYGCVRFAQPDKAPTLTAWCSPLQPGNAPPGAAAQQAAKLEMLEQLLWQGGQARQHSGAAAGLVALAIRLGATFALRRLVLNISDSCWQYSQEGEPGPWNLGKAALTRDAVRISVRGMQLTPASKRAAAMASGGERPTGGGGGRCRQGGAA